MRKNITISIESDILSKFDAARGLTKRSPIINEMLKGVMADNPQKFSSHDMNTLPQKRSAHE